MADTWGGDFVDEHLARQASEDFGTLEFIADIKGEMPVQTRGYHSPLWDDPDKYMHVIQRDPTAHPDDLYALDNYRGFGGVYSPLKNEDYLLEDVIKMMEDSHWKELGGRPNVPHIGSAVDALKKGQIMEGGHFYITPKGLEGAYPSGDSVYSPGHRRDLWQHELGHSTRDYYDLEAPAGMSDEWVARYEDALYGPSQQMKGEALDFLFERGISSPQNQEWGSMAGDVWAKQVMGLLNSNAYPTPGNVKPTLELPFLIPGNPWDM